MFHRYAKFIACFVCACCACLFAAAKADEQKPDDAKTDAAKSDAAKSDALKPSAAEFEFFEKQVRPMLADNCFGCHADTKQKGGLRLDSRAAMLAGGDSGPAIIPGQPDDSRLVKAIHYASDEVQMPPKGKLTTEQIEVLTKWVQMGAPWPDSQETAPIQKTKVRELTADDRAFWSFKPVIEPSLPSVNNAAWVKSPIDRFVLAKLESQELKPVNAADKRTLLRRATFDLIGLPPTPEELDAFVADTSPEAFAKVVDRLLESPHYGERWARHWLDVARYGEDQAHTFQARKYPAGFRYRDWVVKSFNEDLPYNQFLTEQIAADLLDEPNREARLPALGFFAMGPVYYGKSTDDEIDDRIDTLCRGMLSLTVSCARCHDHKFDPVSTVDYYALAGVFNSTIYKEWFLKDDGLIDEERSAKPRDKDQDKKDKDAEKKNEPPRRNSIHAIAEAAEIKNSRVHVRGNANNLADEVPRHFLSILSPDKPLPFQNGSGRLELARAIASRDNPLTARVFVNRVWEHHFGRGLVATPGNFGRLGDPPSHPELLDYLASRFMAEGWSVKKLQRAIMLSSTYQLGSQYDEHNALVDADNVLLWHANRRRLEIEPWRDGILAVSGRLNLTPGGWSEQLNSPDNTRRTLYASISRHDLDPILRLFNFPDPNITADKRAQTLVPIQELFTLNSPLMLKSAEALAARILHDESLTDDTARIRQAYRLVLNRLPSESELKIAHQFIDRANAHYEETLVAQTDSPSEPPAAVAASETATAAEADDAATVEAAAKEKKDAKEDEESPKKEPTKPEPPPKKLNGWEQFAHVLLSSNEFAFVD